MMNRLCLALLLTVATAAVANNVEPEVPSVLGVAELDDPGLDKNNLPMEIIPESLSDNLSLGTIGADDRVLAWINHSVAASYFVTHDQEITIRGFDYTNITAIRVTRVAQSPTAYPSIVAGGLGSNDVTIRLLGTREQGFEYLIQVYSSIGC